MSEALKLCIDCAFVAGSSMNQTEAGYKCRAKENEVSSSVSLVTGERQIAWACSTCIDTRKESSLCGVEGKWWKEREAVVNNTEYFPKKKLTVQNITADMI